MDKKRKPTKRHAEVRHRRHIESPRMKMERMLGRKLIRGEIPIARETCPVPPPYLRDFNNCCKDYAEGKITEGDVSTRVNEILKKIKPPSVSPPSNTQSVDSSAKVEGTS